MSSSSSYQEFAHLQIPLEEIVSATNNFSDANLAGGDSFANDYRGQLMRSGQLIRILARRFHYTYGCEDADFWMEVSMLSKLKHQNIVSIVGFCDENDEKIVIIKHEARGSLLYYLRDPTLTWLQRLHICVDVARALSYIYYDEGRDFSVIHRDITSFKIFLDEHWEAKLSGFESSLNQAAAERDGVCFTAIATGPIGCTDPVYAETGWLSHKSDMFSFGVVLIEVLCGKAAQEIDGDDQHLYQLAKSHFESGTLNDMVHPGLRKDMDPQAFVTLSETAYWCLKAEPSERPNIDQILVELKKAWEFQRKKENPVRASMNLKFAHLQIPHKEIVSATDNFSDANMIGRIEFGPTYKGQLLRSGRLINIVAQRLDYNYGFGDDHFWMEVSMLSFLKHKNIVSIVGFCDENGEKIVINKHEIHGNLYSHLRDPILTWMRRLQICVGVVRALSYMYYDEGRDFSVIHRCISSSTILLDDQWEAKLSDFKSSIYQPAAERDSSLFTATGRGYRGYIDPMSLSTRRVSHKSDIFSFGVVLFEVLCGTKAVVVQEDNKTFYEEAKSHFEGGTLDDMVDPDLRIQMDPESSKIVSEIAYCCLKAEPSERPNIDQIHVELKKALECQQKHENRVRPSMSLKFAHLQIPLEEIVSATNNFSDANLIRQHAFGKEYKGQLLLSGQLIDIVARKLDDKHGQGNKQFWMEVSMLSKLNHKNIISIVGFCDENGEKIIINKRETYGRLFEYVRDPALTWMRRLHISIGVAQALSYIHYQEGRDFSVIHREITSSKILLDDNWEAKLSGFELSMTQTAARRNGLCLAGRAGGTRGYCDPTYLESGSVTHKSDMYSFGIVLFEILRGKEAATADEDIMLFAPSARSHYEGGRLEDMIDPGLWKQMGPQSFKIFSETAYFCLKEQRPQRPDIDQILVNLKQALEYQREHENPLISKASSTVSSTTSKDLKGKDLEHLEIPLNDIKFATNNFAKEYRIGRGAYGDVYKAELDVFDSKSLLLSLEEKSTGKFLKKRSTVAIKHIKNRQDRQGKEGFLAEIEMLTSCKHPNIVSLLGFCREAGHMILVYELASNGSLHDYLGSTGKLTNLNWVQRLKICINIARGLNYLHTKIEDGRQIIHRDIKSDNILLGENWEAKIADFGLSKFRPENLKNTLYTQNLAGTDLYYDPEYFKTGKLKNESDIYSLGVVLFEMLSGRFANDATFTKENSNGIAHVARRHFNEGTIRELVDPRLMEETHENIFTLNRGPHQDSLDAFSKIAYQCVAQSQAERPTAEAVIKKLEESLSFQENLKDQLKFSLQDLELATENYSDNNLIGEGGFGKVYKGEVTHANGRRINIAAKRLNRKSKTGQDELQFLMELQVLMEYKHENIIGLVGYCNDLDERIIVYEYASRKSLDKHLKDSGLTWRKRLEICIDIASGLDFLHGGSLTQDVVIHRDIKSLDVLLTDDWKAKISDFGNSVITPINKDIDFIIDNVSGTRNYVDPLYLESGFLTKESDIYSFGVVLSEILCGRLAFEMIPGDFRGLMPLFKRHFKEGTLDEMVFEGIKKQIAPKSLTTFQQIALRCLHDKREERPTTGEVLLQLKKALELQDDYEIWEPKLPNDYKELISEIYFNENRKNLYHMFSKGILLQKGKVLFSLGGDGERNVMISAKRFLYINHSPHKWRHVPESRFEVVAEMLDILNLKIKIKTRTQLLSPDVTYGVYLVFKFCDPIKVSNEPLYVNLKFRNKRKSSDAYFATWRDKEWMMIELCRFLNNKEHIDFQFLLESFSRCYCESRTIYVEGIEFRAIGNARSKILILAPILDSLLMCWIRERCMNKFLMLQQLPTNCEENLKRSEDDDGGEKLLLLSEVDGETHIMLCAKAALHDYSNVKLYKCKRSTQSSFLEEIEFLPHQVFRISCTINSQLLSPGINYECYLVFKVSEKCPGLHCPVKVRDLLRRNNKKDEIIYFRSPSPWNLHDTIQAPELRTDGWREVKVWKFNLNHEQKTGFHMNLKLISYEGTMSGLIVCGVEFRPV